MKRKTAPAWTPEERLATLKELRAIRREHAAAVRTHAVSIRASAVELMAIEERLQQAKERLLPEAVMDRTVVSFEPYGDMDNQIDALEQVLCPGFVDIRDTMSTLVKECDRLLVASSSSSEAQPLPSEPDEVPPPPPP